MSSELSLGALSSAAEPPARRSIAQRLEIAPATEALMVELQLLAKDEVLTSLPRGRPETYLYDLLPEYPVRGGKGLRPMLCLATSMAYGGSEHEALPFAVALELMHNAFLVHDDIQDGSLLRRGCPTLHVRHGTPLALNAGDALILMSTSMLSDAVRSIRANLAAAVLANWDCAMTQTLEGQALDLGWQRDGRTDVTFHDYLLMAGKKTAWYTTVLPMAMGAIVGSGRVAAGAASFRFAWLLGLLFQVANDLAGLDAEPGEGDIEEGKRTILIVHLFRALQGSDRDELARLMSLPREARNVDEVAWVRARMIDQGSEGFARGCLASLAGAALHEADVAFGDLSDSIARDALFAIVPHLLDPTGNVAARFAAQPI